MRKVGLRELRELRELPSIVVPEKDLDIPRFLLQSTFEERPQRHPGVYEIPGPW